MESKMKIVISFCCVGVLLVFLFQNCEKSPSSDWHGPSETKCQQKLSDSRLNEQQGTGGDDVFSLGVGASLNYYGGAGDDTYAVMVSLPKDLVITINDDSATKSNYLVIDHGLEIQSATLSANEMELQFSNGTKIHLKDPTKFKFRIGMCGGTYTPYEDFAKALVGGTSQPVLPATTATAFTVPILPANATCVATNDIFSIGNSSSSYLGGGGDDTYLITSQFLGNVTAKIVDTEGTNKIIFEECLAIESILFYENACQINVVGGGKVQILGAGERGSGGFRYLVDPTNPTLLTYTEFAKEFGVAPPFPKPPNAPVEALGRTIEMH